MTDPTAWAGLTTGLAGLVSAGVAGVAVVVTSRHARAALDAQRTLLEHQQSLELRRTRETRLWEKRSDTYVDLLGWLRSALASMSDEGRELEVPDLPASLQDEVSAFASDAVVAGVRALTESLVELGFRRTESLARREQDTDEPEFRSWLATYQSARDEVVTAYNSLWDEVRQELNPEATDHAT